MRSPTHWDGVASRHGDPLTRWFEDAVDEADDEAERGAQGVPVGRVQEAGMPSGGEQQRVVPDPRGVQPAKPAPPRRSKELTLNLTDEEYAAIKAMADGDEMPPSTWARLRVMDALGLLGGG